MSYTRPDIYVEETLSSPFRRSALLSAPLPVFIGTSFRGPTEFTIVNSWSDYVAKFGGFSPSGTDGYLPFAVHQYFRSGTSSVAIQRVYDSAASVVATVNLPDRAGTPVDTLKVDAKDPGLWGSDIYVGIVDRDAVTGRFDVIVYYGGSGASNQVERFSDVSMSPLDPRFVETTINSVARGSQYITVSDLVSGTAAPDNAPAAGITQLAGGDDGTVDTADYTDAVDAVDVTNASLVISIPGNSETSVINAAVALAQGRKNSFVVIDTPAGSDVATAVTYSDSLAVSSYGASYWPWVNIANPSVNQGGATKLIPPSGGIVAAIVRTDAEIGPQQTPAGRGINLPGVISLETEPTLADLGTANAAHLNALRTFPGTGVVVWGGRTLQKTGADRFISVRRTLIHLTYQLSELISFAVFEPNDATLWQGVRDECDRFLRAFWQKGGLSGASAAEAYYVLCSSQNNTPQSVAEGVLNVEVGVAPQRPAEFVVLKLGQFETGQIQVEEEV